MSTGRPLNTDDLTGPVKLFAESLEPRLQQGAKTFHSLRLVVAALAPLVVAALALGAYSTSIARKSDVEAQTESEQAHHAELERRTSVLEDARKAEVTARAESNASLLRYMEHVDKRLDEIFMRLGEPQPNRGAHR